MKALAAQTSPIEEATKSVLTRITDRDPLIGETIMDNLMMGSRTIINPMMGNSMIDGHIMDNPMMDSNIMDNPTMGNPMMGSNITNSLLVMIQGFE